MSAHDQPGRVVKYVKLHGQAVEDGEITELAPGASQRIHTATLHYEGEAVASREGPFVDAHSERGGEIPDANPLVGKERARLTSDDVRQTGNTLNKMRVSIGRQVGVVGKPGGVIDVKRPDGGSGSIGETK